MVEIFEQQKAHFRIVIHDLKTKKTKSISLLNHENYTLEDLKEEIISCITKKKEK